MSRILFVTHGTMALGETYVTSCCAQDLQDAGHEVRFMAPPFGAKFLEDSGFFCHLFVADLAANTTLCEEILRDWSPDLILLTDYYFFRISEFFRLHLDLQAFFQSGVPVGVFDNGNFYTSTGVGKFRTTFSYITPDTLLPPLPRRTNFLLKPCPPHDPTRDETSVFRYRLRADGVLEFPDSRTIQSVREAVGCPPGSRMVVWPVAGYLYELRWTARLNRVDFDDEGKGGSAGFPTVNRRPQRNWYYHLNRLIVSYLQDLGTPIHLVNVSQYASEYGAPNSGDVTVHNIEPVGFDRFEALLAASDAYFIDNRFSTTLARALFHPAKAVCLINTLQIHRRHDGVRPSFALSERARNAATTIERAHPRSIRPSYFSHLGWKGVLENLLRDNAFGETYQVLDIFRDAEAVATLRRALVDEAFTAKTVAAKGEYIRKMRQLPSMADVVADRIKTAQQL